MVDSEMAKQWVYRYDEQGNRIGLVEVQDTPGYGDKLHDGSCWFNDIEDVILAKEPFYKRRTNIEPIELDIQKAEVKSLSDDRFKMWSSHIKFVEHIYFTEGGLKVSVEERFIQQDWSYINSFIQRELGSRGLVMSRNYIRYLLESEITSVYIAAEVQGVPVRVAIGKTLRKQLQLVA